PKASSTFRTIYSLSDCVETSVGTAMTCGSYLLVTSSALDVDVSPLLATNATFIFSPASFSAIAFPLPLLAHVTLAVFGCIVYTSFILHLILRNCPFSHDSYHHLFTLLQKYSLYSFLCILVLHSKCQLPGHPLFGFLLIVVRVVHTVQVPLVFVQV